MNTGLIVAIAVCALFLGIIIPLTYVVQKSHINEPRNALLSRLNKLKVKFPELTDMIKLDIEFNNLSEKASISEVLNLKKTIRELDSLSNFVVDTEESLIDTLNEATLTMRIREFLEQNKIFLETSTVQLYSLDNNTKYTNAFVYLSESLVAEISKNIDAKDEVLKPLLIKSTYCVIRITNFLEGEIE